MSGKQPLYKKKGDTSPLEETKSGESPSKLGATNSGGFRGGRGGNRAPHDGTNLRPQTSGGGGRPNYQKRKDPG